MNVSPRKVTKSDLGQCVCARAHNENHQATEIQPARKTGVSPCSYHHIVVHVPQLVDIHGALCSAAVAPRGAGGRHWALTWLAAWGELKVGAVWLPVKTQQQGYMYIGKYNRK